jgi:hypothetical protein
MNHQMVNLLDLTVKWVPFNNEEDFS